jgi:hypothetical protein
LSVCDIRCALTHGRATWCGMRRTCRVIRDRVIRDKTLTLWGVSRNDVVTNLDRHHTLADRLDNGAGFVAKDGREEPFGVRSAEGVDVRVAQSVGYHLDPHLASLGGCNDDLALAEIVDTEPASERTSEWV